jgi:prenyltransferase beta subunit
MKGGATQTRATLPLRYDSGFGSLARRQSHAAAASWTALAITSLFGAMSPAASRHSSPPQPKCQDCNESVNLHLPETKRIFA